MGFEHCTSLLIFIKNRTYQKAQLKPRTKRRIFWETVTPRKPFNGIWNIEYCEIEIHGQHLYVPSFGKVRIEEAINENILKMNID